MSFRDAIKVGTVTLDKPTIFRRHYETAAWYTDVEVAAGTYDVVAYAEGRRWLVSPSIVAEGNVVAEYLAALWCGVPVGGKTHDNLGRIERVVGGNVSPKEVALLPSFKLGDFYIERAAA